MDVKRRLQIMDQIDQDNREYVREFMEGKKMLKGVLFDVESGYARKVESPNNLDGLYKALNCEYIETFAVDCAYGSFTVVLDEQGKVNGDKRVSGLCFNRFDDIVDYFVGNILIISREVTADGDMVGLTDEEVNTVLDKYTKKMFDRDVFVCYV